MCFGDGKRKALRIHVLVLPSNSLCNRICLEVAVECCFSRKHFRATEPSDLSGSFRCSSVRWTWPVSRGARRLDANKLTAHSMLVHFSETRRWNWQRVKLKSKEWTKFGSTFCRSAPPNRSSAKAALAGPLCGQIERAASYWNRPLISDRSRMPTSTTKYFLVRSICNRKRVQLKSLARALAVLYNLAHWSAADPFQGSSSN